MKVVLVTGARGESWPQPLRLTQALEAWFGAREPGVLIEGEASGVDVTARMVAERLGWEVERFPAQWQRPKPDGSGTFYAPWAGPERNQQMVDRAVLRRTQGHDVEVVAFHPLGEDVLEAKKSGTADCCRKAQAAGFSVEVVKP